MGPRVIIPILLAASMPLCAESALLKNGYRMHVERHVTEGQTVRLFLNGGGTMEVSAADVDRFEPDELVNTVVPAEPIDEVVLVFPDTLYEVVRDADVKGTVPAAREHVDVVHRGLDSRFRGNDRGRVSQSGKRGSGFPLSRE